MWDGFQPPHKSKLASKDLLIMLSIYKEPIDLFNKLVREAMRTWQSDQITDKNDHFLNFCITSLSLRDWCSKYLNLSDTDTKTFQLMHSQHRYLNLIGNIANTSKHYTLDVGRKKIFDDINTTSQEFTAMGLDGVINNDVSIQKNNLIIKVDDNTEENLFVILINSYEEWREIFNQYNIPMSNLIPLPYIFMTL